MDCALTYIMILQQALSFLINIELLWKFDMKLINGSIVIAHMFVVFIRSQNCFQHFTTSIGLATAPPDHDIFTISLKYLSYLYTDELQISHNDIIDFLKLIVDFRMRIFENVCINFMAFNAWLNDSHEMGYQVLEDAINENWKICQKMMCHLFFTKIHFNLEIKSFGEIFTGIVDNVMEIDDERHSLILEAIVKLVTDFNWNLEINCFSPSIFGVDSNIMNFDDNCQQNLFNGDTTVRIFKGSCKVLS